MKTGVGSFGIGLAFLFAANCALGAPEYQLESCQYIDKTTESDESSVPPGLDEPLNCDHKCFYDELGIDLLGDRKPTLHDMYSIGWRLIDVERVQYEGQRIWTVYLERKSDGRINQCEKTYEPKKTDEKSMQDSS